LACGPGNGPHGPVPGTPVTVFRVPLLRTPDTHGDVNHVTSAEYYPCQIVLDDSQVVHEVFDDSARYITPVSYRNP